MDYTQLISLKIASLKKQIREVEKEKEAAIEEYDRKIKFLKYEIEKFDPLIKAMEEVVKDYACPRCNGSGSVRRCDAAGQMEDVECPDCNGRGFVVK